MMVGVRVQWRTIWSMCTRCRIEHVGCISIPKIQNNRLQFSSYAVITTTTTHTNRIDEIRVKRKINRNLLDSYLLTIDGNKSSISTYTRSPRTAQSLLYASQDLLHILCACSVNIDYGATAVAAERIAADFCHWMRMQLWNRLEFHKSICGIHDGMPECCYCRSYYGGVYK